MDPPQPFQQGFFLSSRQQRDESASIHPKLRGKRGRLTTEDVPAVDDSPVFKTQKTYSYELPTSGFRLSSESVDSGLGSSSRLSATFSEDITPPGPGVCAPPFGICLKDWKGSRVLARPPGQELYHPGYIKIIQNDKDIGVQLDFSDSTPVFYVDVLDPKFVDVIADQAPAPGEVKIGTIVCGRQSVEVNVWQRAEVVGISMQPVSFQVKFWDCTTTLSRKMPTPEAVWVPRANVRLIRPPWFEEMTLEPVVGVTTVSELLPQTANVTVPMPGNVIVGQHQQVPLTTAALTSTPSTPVTPQSASSVKAAPVATVISGSSSSKKSSLATNEEVSDDELSTECADNCSERLSTVGSVSGCTTPRSVTSGPERVSGSLLSPTGGEGTGVSGLTPTQRYKKGEVVTTQGGIRKNLTGNSGADCAPKKAATRNLSDGVTVPGICP